MALGARLAAGVAPRHVSIPMIKRLLAISLLSVCAPALAAAQVIPVGSEFQVNAYTSNDQGFPDVCSDAGGNFVVVWSSTGAHFGPNVGQDGDLAGVFARRFASDGAPRGSEFQVNTYTSNIQAFPAMACVPSGAFVVVWNSYKQDGNGYGIFGQRYDSMGAASGTEFEVNSFTPFSQDYASITSDSAGNFVVVWASYTQDGDGFGIFGRRYASTGEPLTTEFQVNTWFTASQSVPAIVGDDDGRFVIVWTSSDQDGDDGGVFGQRFDSLGLRAGTEFQVNSHTAGRQHEAAISADGDGNFVVVWTSTDGDGSGSSIFGQRFDPGGAEVGLEFLVNTDASGSAYVPDVAVDPMGSFVVVWTTYRATGADGEATGVFGRRFEPSGDAVGSEFQVNLYTYSQQSYPAIAARGARTFVVTWQSYGQDGSHYACEAAAFDLGPTPLPTPTQSATQTATHTPSPTSSPTSTVTSAPPTPAPHTPTATATTMPISTATASQTVTVSPALRSPTSTAPPKDTATATPTSSTAATPVPSSTASAIATPAVSCTGDCNHDGNVSVSELITVVYIALGQLPAGACPALEADEDETVTVDKIVVAVDNSIDGCPETSAATVRQRVRSTSPP